jgi:hypothetical protein
MASVAICTAVWNPNVKSVADRSLSIVLGTPTTFTPSVASLCATPSVSSPPIAMSAETRSLASVAFTLAAPSSDLYGFVRDVPRIVPPRGSSPRTEPTLRSMDSPVITPRQPWR